MVPSGFDQFCALHGVSDTPAEWDAQTRDLFMAWKLAHFREKWRWYIAHGYPDIVRKLNGRQALIDQVRNDVRDAVAPAPSRVYGAVRMLEGRSDPRVMPPETVIEALAFIRSFKPARQR
jgi:hypothetical protein